MSPHRCKHAPPANAIVRLHKQRDSVTDQDTVVLSFANTEPEKA